MGKPSNHKDVEHGGRVRVWLTRSEVVKQLGISYSRLLTYEGYGWLHKRRAADVGARTRGAPRGGRPAAIVYDQDEVNEIGRRRRIMRRASVAQRAFAAFARGQGVVQVVIELGVEPEVAAELYRDYATAAGGLYLPGDVVGELTRMGFQVTVQTFPDMVRKLLDAARGRTPRAAQGVRFLPDTGERS